MANKKLRIEIDDMRDAESLSDLKNTLESKGFEVEIKGKINLPAISDSEIKKWAEETTKNMKQMNP